MSKTHDFSFSEGETFYFLFALRDASGLPLDMTDGSVEWAVSSITDSSTVFIATTANGLIVMTSPTTGEGYVRIDPVDHAILPGGEYTHALRAILASGLVSEQMSGRMTIGESPFGTVDGGQSFFRSTGLQMIYSSNVDEADPGAGTFRFNSGFTEAYVDLEDRFGVDITDWLDALDDSTNGNPYGYIRFTKLGTESTWYEFSIRSSVVANTGYRTLRLSLIAGQGSLTDGDGFALSWSRTGDSTSFGTDFTFFGGNGDGATDNADAFDAAHTWMASQLSNGIAPTLIFRPGTYKTSRPANFTNLRNTNGKTIIRGNGAVIWGYDGCANKCVVDAMQSQHIYIEDLCVKGDTTDIPNNGIQIGVVQYSSGYKVQTSSNVVLVRCTSVGYFNWAPIYNNASEINYQEACTWRNELSGNIPIEDDIVAGTEVVGKRYAAIIDDGNRFGVTSDYVTVSLPVGGAVSCLQQCFVDCSFVRINGGAGLFVGSGCGWLSMRNCYSACRDGDTVIVYIARYYNASPTPGLRSTIKNWSLELHMESDTTADSGLTFRNGFRLVPVDNNSGVAYTVKFYDFTWRESNFHGDDTCFLMSKLFPSGSNVSMKPAYISIGGFHGSTSAGVDDLGPPNLGVFYPANSWQISGDLFLPTTDTYSGTHNVGFQGRYYPSSPSDVDAWYPRGSYEIMRSSDSQPALHKGHHQFGLNDTTATYTGADVPFAHYVGFEDGKINFSGGPVIEHGTGSPESSVTGSIGSLYFRTDGSAGTTYYRKTSGSGNTGWASTFVPADINYTASSFWGGQIYRFNDRVFIGEAASNFTGNTASVPDGGTSWLGDDSTAPAYLGVNASLLVTTANAAGGPYGIVSGVKTSLNISTGGIAFGAAVVNDKAQGRTWAYIAETQLEPGAWTTNGMEVAAKNKSGVNYTYNPYFENLGVFGVRLAAGGDNAFGGAATDPSTVGLLIIKNASTWNTGIVIMPDSITGQTGALGDDSANVDAISMGRRHQIAWYEPTNSSTGAVILSSVNSHAKRVGIEFSDDAVKLFGSSGDILLKTNFIASGGDHIEIDNCAAGNSPIIKAVGASTNVNIQITPKGTGRLRYGTWTSNADAPVNGYIEIVDSGGTIRKLATIA